MKKLEFLALPVARRELRVDIAAVPQVPRADGAGTVLRWIRSGVNARYGFLHRRELFGTGRP
jgi:hypothetical protein